MSEENRKTPDASNAQEEPVEKIDLGSSLRKEHKDKKPVNRIAVLIGLAAVLVVAACLAIFLPQVLSSGEEAVEEDTAVQLSQHETGDVVSITVDGENTFTITKEEQTTGEGEDAVTKDVYFIEGMADDWVNQSTCSSAFVNAATMEADQLVEENAQDMAKYGLDTPSCVLTVQYDDGSLTLELGDLQTLTGQIYCRVQGEDDVYILRPYFANIFGGSLLRYRSLTLPEISSDVTNCTSIVINQRGQETVTFVPMEDPTSFATGTWKMTEPRELWLDSGAISELVESMSSYSLYDYVGQVDDLSPYGLDDPWFSITITDNTGATRTLMLGDQMEDETRYYCAIDDSGEVFTISTSYTSFAEDFKVSYYLDAFTNIVSITAVDKLTVTDGTKTYEMTIERQEQYEEDGSLKTLANGSPDYLETFRLNGVEQQEDAFKEAYQTIIGVTISNIAEESLVDESQKPVLTLTYTLNNTEEQLVIEYLPYDINNYCVRRNGKVDLICKKDLVDPIMPILEDLEAGRLNEEEEE